MTNLSLQLDQAFEEFRDKIKDHIKPKVHYDEYLLRFLKARQFDVDKGAEMFIASMKWRESFGADTILKTFPQSKYYQLLKDYWPGVLIGQTKDGSYIFVERIGCVDPKSLFRSVPVDELLRFHVFTMEGHEKRIRKQYKKRGSASPLVIVQDCKGVGLKHTMKAGIDFIRRISDLDSANYPEILRKMYFINAPSLFTGIFAMLKPFIDPVTLSKLEVLGSNYFESLTELIDDKVLPPCVGGSNNAPFPEAGTFETALTKSGTSVNVSSGDKHRHEVPVTKGSRVEYQFSTEDYNISFGIFHKPANDKTERIVTEHVKHESHQEMVWHEVNAEEDGILVFEWDNSYSKWRSKTLSYHVHVHSSSAPTSPVITSSPKKIKSKKQTISEDGSGGSLPAASISALTSTSASSCPSSPTFKQESGSRSSSPSGSPVLKSSGKKTKEDERRDSSASSDTLGF